VQHCRCFCSWLVPWTVCSPNLGHICAAFLPTGTAAGSASWQTGRSTKRHASGCSQQQHDRDNCSSSHTTSEHKRGLGHTGPGLLLKVVELVKTLGPKAWADMLNSCRRAIAHQLSGVVFPSALLLQLHHGALNAFPAVFCVRCVGACEHCCGHECSGAVLVSTVSHTVTAAPVTEIVSACVHTLLPSVPSAHLHCAVLYGAENVYQGVRLACSTAAGGSTTCISAQMRQPTTMFIYTLWLPECP
jgi:hypothetical protein